MPLVIKCTCENIPVSSNKNELFSVYIIVYDVDIFKVDLFGECPVQYSVYNHKPGSIFTSRDLTLCAMPQLYQLQMRFFSVIKKLHGGYAERKTSEVRMIKTG